MAPKLNLTPLTLIHCIDKKIKSIFYCVAHKAYKFGGHESEDSIILYQMFIFC